jgi:hypothetical protein
MAGQDKPPQGPKAEREARLAQALRANLRRRKAAPTTPAPSPAEEKPK